MKGRELGEWRESCSRAPQDLWTPSRRRVNSAGGLLGQGPSLGVACRSDYHLPSGPPSIARFQPHWPLPGPLRWWWWWLRPCHMRIPKSKRGELREHEQTRRGPWVGRHRNEPCTQFEFAASWRSNLLITKKPAAGSAAGVEKPPGGPALCVRAKPRFACMYGSKRRTGTAFYFTGRMSARDMGLSTQPRRAPGAG